MTSLSPLFFCNVSFSLYKCKRLFCTVVSDEHGRSCIANSLMWAWIWRMSHIFRLYQIMHKDFKLYIYYFRVFIHILSFQAGNFSPGNTRIFPYKSNMFIGFSITAVKRFSDYGAFVHRLPQGLDLIRAAFRTQKNRSLNAANQRIRKCAN